MEHRKVRFAMASQMLGQFSFYEKRSTIIMSFHSSPMVALSICVLGLFIKAIGRGDGGKLTGMLFCVTLSL